MNLHVVSASDKKGVFLKMVLPGFEPFWFYRAGGSEIETTLLQEKIDKQLNEQLQSIRRTSYLRGWRNAKSKKKKDDWFASCLDVLDWEKKEAGL